jgi:predicted membrane protein
MDSFPSSFLVLPKTFWKLQLQSCVSARYLEILFGIVFTNVWFISVKKLSIFSRVVGVFLLRKFKLNYENFKLINQRKENPVIRPMTIGKGVGDVALENFRVVVWCIWP